MKLTKIQSLNFGTFKNFQWSNTTPNFHNGVNVLLGWNGSGKTIISRMLRAYEKGGIEARDKINGATFSVAFSTGTKKHNELSGYDNKIRIFNEDYIQEIVSKTHLDYVVALGKTEVDFSEKQRELDGVKRDFSKLTKCKNEHDEIATKTAEDIRRIQGIAHINKDSSIESNGRFDSYYKSSFEKRVVWLEKQVEQEKKIDDFIQTDDELQKLQTELSNLAEKKREYQILKKWNDWVIEKLEKINWSLEFEPTYEQSERIDGFGSDSNEEKWIRDGVKIHNLTDDNHLATCIFCNSTIVNRDELLKHFSDDVIKLSTALDTLDSKITTALSEISSCETFYTNKKNDLESFFEDIQKKVTEKKKSKSKSVSVVSFDNLFIEKESFGVEATAWTIEIDYVARKYEQYQTKKTEYKTCEEEHKRQQGNIQKIENELRELKKEAKNIKIPATRINQLLESTFPYKKIRLDDSVDEVGYVLKRNDIECSLDSLSEGERNFIALAYFLLSINDEDKKLDEQSIIMIDDPVSSLDSDSLFQVYAILFGEIERHEDRQYFILTHNLDFFGHLLQNYKKADGRIKDDLVSFYQIRSGKNGSAISELPDTLKNYRSDYQYAISKLDEIKDSQSLDDSILTANLLRRALETFLHFKYGYGDFRSKLEKMYAKCKKIKIANTDPARKDEVEQEIVQEEKVMYRFVNHGSHEFLGLEKYDISVLQGSKQRIENFFDVIKTIDKDHYKTFVLNENNN